MNLIQRLGPEVLSLATAYSLARDFVMVIEDPKCAKYT